MAGAKQVIFVDADVSTAQSGVDILGQRHRNASIYTRALNVDSAEIDWNGKARSPEPFTVH